MLLRLRCYLPSTSATLLILAVAFIAFHGAASHAFAGLGLATEIVIGLGLAGLAAGTIVISAVTIQRRRAAAGACHACSHPCRGAMVPLPEIDTRRWPHRPLTQPPRTSLPLVVRAVPAPNADERPPHRRYAAGTPEPQRLGFVAIKLNEPRLRVRPDGRDRERDLLPVGVDQDKEVVVEQRRAVVRVVGRVGAVEVDRDRVHGRVGPLPLGHGLAGAVVPGSSAASAPVRNRLRRKTGCSRRSVSSRFT